MQSSLHTHRQLMVLLLLLLQASNYDTKNLHLLPSPHGANTFALAYCEAAADTNAAPVAARPGQPLLLSGLPHG